MPLTVTTRTTEARSGAGRLQRRAPVFSQPITPDERLAAIALSFVRGLGAARISTKFRGRDGESRDPTGRGEHGASRGTAVASRGDSRAQVAADDVARAFREAGDDAPPVSTIPSAVLRAVAADATERAGLLARAQQMLVSCEARGIRVVSFVESAYPPALFHLEGPPPLLYALGDLSITARPSVAIVGSRHATGYGLRVARDFAARLAEHGVCVVSGLAAGIDAASHLGALDACGATIAVQGTGVDVPYPRGHAALHARIAREGLVLSELSPGEPTHRGAFPNRNRIIAALADVVLVVEAGLPSGALLTAERGDAINRPVGAIPGPIDAAMSRGTNQLIRDGRHCIASFDDLLALLALTPRVLSQGGRLTAASAAPGGRGNAGAASGASQTEGAEPTTEVMRRPAFAWSGDASSPEGRLVDLLAYGPQGTDDLVRACAMSPRDVATALGTLSMLGVIEVDAGGMVQRRDRSTGCRASAAR